MKKNATIAARAGVGFDKSFGSVMPPLYLSANYSYEGYKKPRKYDYTRTANPTRDLLGEALAELECGAGAIVTSSGMSAVHLVTQLLKPGELIVAPHDGYGGTFRLLNSLSKKGHYEVLFVDQNDAIALQQALFRNPKLVWIETPSNPLLRIVDIQRVANAAHAVGALVVADNTFLSPALQKPILLGADFVVHSTTKYLNGHSDVVGGAVIAKDKALHQELAWWANCLGITGAPFDSYLTLRGIRTLEARLRVHQENAQAIADFLANHAAIRQVYYPGLPEHPGHQIARRQQNGFGAMLSFEVCEEALDIESFLSHLELFSLAESLGGVESLIAHPATMTHASMTPEAREKAGISNSLLRVSVGIENCHDLLRDVNQAVRKAEEFTVVKNF